MALQDVLGAMKLLIMDQPQLATDPELRAKQLRDLVPGLSLDEASDMAKMPAEGLAIYSRSIYSHQWKMLKSRLPVSYRVLERDWPQVYNEPFSDRILVEALQRQRPWRGNRFETFVGNFRSFILEDYGKLVAHVPYIEDLLCLEYAGFIVRLSLIHI